MEDAGSIVFPEDYSDLPVELQKQFFKTTSPGAPRVLTHFVM